MSLRHAGRPVRARRLLGLAGGIAGTVAFMAAASPALGYVRIDNQCILRAELPTFQNPGSYTGGPELDAPGITDCSGESFFSYNIQNQACVQVYNGTFNQWYSTGTCGYTQSGGGSNVIGPIGYKANPVNGHVYHTWTWGADQYTNPGPTNTATYQSSSFTCGC
jgi:hypothetical protein